MTPNYWQNPHGMSRATIRTIINQIGVVDPDIQPRKQTQRPRFAPVDHPRNISTRDRYREVLAMIGHPANCHQIAAKMGNESTAVRLFNRRNPGFFEITRKKVDGKTVFFYWIVGLDRQGGEK